MSVIPEPRLLRIRTLQRAYSALQQDLPYLEERINLLRAAVSSFLIQHLHQPDVVLLAQHHRDIGAALYDRYMHLRDLKDLEEAETHLRLALSETNGSPSASFPGPSHLLGSVLRENASQRKNAQVATEALALHREPFAGHDYSRASTLQQAHYSRELGLTLVINYLTNSTDVHVLSESIRRLEDARSAFATMHVSDHISYLGICRALNGLCAIKLEHAQMEDAITYGRLALTLCGHAHRDLFWVTQALSNVYIYYTWSFDNVDSLNTAISLYREALSSAPPRWASLLTVGLLNALDLRYDRTHREEDLMEATTLIAALIIDSSPADEAWARLQNLHANFLYRRFQTTGVQNDIDAAVHAANAAVSATAIGTPHYPNRMQLVAGCRIEQYKAFGDVVHLNEAIGILEHTVQTVVLHSAFWMDAASELLEGYHHRYGATGDVTDLNRAICLLSALRTTHEGRVKDAPLELYRVGYAFLARFATTGALKDLDQATMLHQEAAAHASAHYHTHKIMGSYASTLRVRYVTLGEEESVVRALDMQNKAVAALSEVHPDRPEVICGLAQLHLSMRPSQATVSEALDLLLDALSNNYCPAYKRFKCVSDVLRYLNTHRPEGLDHLENALKLSLVYSTIIALLPQVASFGLEPRARLAVMTGAGQLTIQGAVHAISMVKLDEALEMLEAGRSVFWTQGLRLRTPFTDLLRAIGDQLTKITYALSRPPLEGPDKDHELSRRRKLGDEFQAVLAEARLEPGFEDLLRNASFEVLARAASHHPVVVLVAGDASGHAVIVSENAQCILVGLPRATNKALRALATHVEARVKTVRSLRGMRRVQATDAQPHDVYKQLWTLVMRPIVEALKWPIAKGRDRRRLTLCPTGVFMQLPLHAAGIYSGDERVSCSDYFVASYTPSISALLHAQQTAQPVRRSEAETLLVAVQKPFWGVPLPMVDMEADIVREHVFMSSKVTQVSACDDVLRQIHSASVLHLACHGTQNPSDALQSGFYLEDELLSVSKLMELDLPRAFLAVLSACETAKGDATQPDQAIHLAAAMLFAGFKSVIATMWFMGDLEGPVVAESVYTALFKAGDPSEHLDPDDVPYALDDAVRKMRESGLDPSFWATYVHIGI